MQRGSTYIETIIAITLFAICTTSLFAVYFQSVKNSRYAERQYIAALTGENIMTDILAQMKLQLQSELEISDYELSEFLNQPEIEAQLNGFIVCVGIKKILANSLSDETITISNTSNFDYESFFDNTSINSEYQIFGGGQSDYLIKVIVIEQDKTLYTSVDLCSILY